MALIAVLALVTSAHWLLAALFTGFVARVAAGPTLSPLALLATRVVAPRLGPPREVSGPPKRFAQAMGAAMTGIGALLALGFGLEAGGDVALAALIDRRRAGVGVRPLSGLQRLRPAHARAGLVPEDVCVECADIWSPPGMARSPASG